MKKSMFIRKLQRKLFVVLLIVVSANYVSAQDENLQLNKWITNWHLLGPIELEKGTSKIKHLGGFENDILSSHGGESNIQVLSGQTEVFEDDTLTWFEYTSTKSIIRLDYTISTKSYLAAYAYTEIFSEKEQHVIISLGTDDGGRFWVNGNEVWDYTGTRGIILDEDLIPILLKKGLNKILLKVEDRGGAWGFCMRILPWNVDSLIKIGKYFDIVTLPNGDSELRLSLSEQIVDNLFNSVKLEIFSNDIHKDRIWKGDWTKKKIMKLPIQNGEIEPYILKISGERKDGKKWKNKILFNSGKRINHTLFSNKNTEYKIVVGKDASESEQWAATELQKTLMEISGVNFEIASDESELTEKEMVIGYNKHSQELLGDDFNEPELLDESFIYKNIKSNIVLVGGKQRGTMYAVFSFLEKTFGVRWYTPNVTVIPKREQYVFNYINHYEEPSIQVRNDYYYEAFDPTWAAHNKINGAMGFRKQHGDIEGYWAVHTFNQFMPPSEFYDKHPEYYSLIDGERISDRTQLCLTNPDVLDIVTERLRVVMRENPSNLIYSVSQNDWGNPCQCDNCQAIVDEMGGQSGIMVWFVNQVADRIKDEFPNKYVGTLAYTYTRKPPKNIKPKENVVIRLCSIECCFAHDFKSCPVNKEFLSDMEEWSGISPNLYIWDYVVNFSHYLMPYPNFNVLQSNIKTFRDNSAIGIMEQAAYQSRGGESAELRAYLISKLLWNAECDVDKVIDDFMYGYYGRSGQYVKEYFELLHKQVTDETHISLNSYPNATLFSAKFIKEADKIFDMAEIVAENYEIKARVEMARLPIMYLKCTLNPANSKYDGTYERLNKIIEREGITHISEKGKREIDKFHYRMKNYK